MFHPVGSQSSSVYWRRRLMFLATVLVLLVLIVVTVRVVLGGNGDAAPPAGVTSRSVPKITPHSTPKTPDSPTHRTGTSTSMSSSDPSTRTAGSTPPVASCMRDDLQVRGVTDHSSYSVGDHPKLMLEVTNTGKSPCVQDLADPEIVLQVYNGESRVWGSHDCLIQSRTNDVTLEPGAPVRVTIEWSGLSSKDNDAHTQAACGPRQAVGAGTYTLYPYLSGKVGHAAQFSIG